MKTSTELSFSKLNLLRLFILICTTAVSTVSFGQSRNAQTQTWLQFTGNYSDVNLGCNPANPQASLGSASATSACGGVTITYSDGPVIRNGCNRSQKRTFTAKDACGHTATKSRTVRWTYDHTPPTINISGGGSLDLGCNPSSININNVCGNVTANDNCCNPTLTTYDGPVVSQGCYRSQTRKWTAKDACGNTATASRTITWIYDHTPPSFTGSYADIDLGCNPANPSGSLGTASATDACGAVTITSSTGSVVSNGCNRYQKRTFTAKDGCGNIATKSRTVRWISDQTPPTINISGGGSLDLGCNPSSININNVCGNVTANDNCCNPTLTSSDGPIVSQGCYRSQTRTWTAKDACGNTSTAARTITWIVDHTPPSFTGSYGDVNLGCNPTEPAGSLGTATATDACGAVTITSSTGSVVNEGCYRSLTRKFTAKDGCGNTATISRTVRWISDSQTPPSFTGNYTDVDLGCNPTEPAGSLGTATATDACSTATITFSDGSVVSNGCNRSRTRTFTAKDGCNNTATISRTVRWISDLTPPSFTGDYGTYDNVSLICNAENAPGSLGSASATDACGPVTITSSDGSVVSDGCSRSITRTFTAKDGCNNTATISRTVSWLAITTSPIISVGGQSISGTTIIDLLCNPSDVQINATLGTGNATNGCGNTPSPTVTAQDGPVTSDGCARAKIRTFTATDGCGHISTAAIKVIWIINNLGPQINTQSTTPTNLGCNPSSSDINAALGTVSATDACANITITSSDGSVVSDGCSRSKTRTFTATGGCGNTATASRTVTWTSDQTPPSFTGSYTDVNLGCNPTEPAGSLGSASATDACGAVTITSSDGSVLSNGCNRSQKRTFTAKDGCGNTATTSRTVRWTFDHTAPTIILTGDCPSDLGCNPGSHHDGDGDDDDDDNYKMNRNTTNNPPNDIFCNATATDACGTPTLTSSVSPVISNGCNRSQTKTWTAKDACGNTSTASRTVTWIEDHTPPVFTGSYADVDLGCNPTEPAGSLGTATATDACGAVTITASTGTVISNGCSRSQKRTFTARDGCGNTATKSRTVRWTFDHTAPTIIIAGNCPSDLGCNPVIHHDDGDDDDDDDDEGNDRVSTNGGNSNGIFCTATATDACGKPTLTSIESPVVSNGCNRSQTKTWTAKDACGNTSTASRTVTWIEDHTPPVFTGNYGDVNLTCNAENAPGSLGTATATDACGAVTITSSTGSIVSNDCLRSITRTFTAKDGCGNTATISRTVRWKALTIPPILLILGQPIVGTTSFDLGCNPPDLEINATLGVASATSLCGTPTVTATTSPLSVDGCARVQSRTFTATDDCGNIATAVRIVRWIVNNLGPQINTTSSTPTALGCNPSSSDINAALGTVTATDACANITITSSDGSVVSEGCSRSITRTFTATGTCGNTASASRTVTWTSDQTPPSFTGSYGDVNLGCNPPEPAGSLGTATATDACGAVTITSSNGSVVSDGCSRSQKRTFTAKDGCGNTATISRTVRWTSDVAPPSFTSSFADVDLGCNPANPQASLGTATATDACGAVTITSDDGLVISNGCNRTQRRTFTAKDACGNAVIASRTIRWTSDNTPPTIILTCGSLDLGCNPGNNSNNNDKINTGGNGNAINFNTICSATATDACGPTTLTSSDGAVVSNGCNRSLTRTWTAKDACGNTSTASRTITWTEDHTDPVFTGDYDFVYLGCNPDDPQASLGSATATDACGTVTITSFDGPVLNLGCLYFQTRFFTAKDACGNIAVKSRTVKWISDLTPPIILIVGDRSPDLGCNPSSVDLDDICGIVTAFDLCSIHAELTHSDGPVVSNGCSRSQTRTWTATDGCGNTATKSITATWIVDHTPPSFTGSYSDVNLGCNPPEPAGSLGTATATDACGAVTITSSTGTVVNDGCNRSQKRTFTARDACGNTATTSRTVRWTSDVTPPVFTSSLADVDLGCNPANPQASLGTATATDACGAVTITSEDGLVLSNGCNRAQRRTFTAKDACGNAVIASRTVRWTADLTPPSFTGNYGDVNLGCNPTEPAGSLGSASATDACGAVTITSSDGSVLSNGCNRSQKRTFSAKDACGNTATTSRTVRWTFDHTAPTIIIAGDCPSDLGCNPGSHHDDGDDDDDDDDRMNRNTTNNPPNDIFCNATATDACGTPTLTSSVGPVISNGCNRSQTKTWTAKDACGNTSTASRTVTWIEDHTPPVFTGSYADVDLGCNPEDPEASLGSASATDACGGVTITSFTGPVISHGCERSQKRTFIAKDACGNIATKSRTVNWIYDHTPPTIIIIGSSSLDLGCNPTSVNIIDLCGYAIAIDDCCRPTLTSSDGPVVSDGCSRSQTRKWTATDGCGNTATKARTVRWIVDHTPPSFTGGYSDIDLGCNPTEPAGSLGIATATDACGAVTVTSSNGSVVSDGCYRSQKRTFTAKDGCGNTATISRTVRWTFDVTPPSFTSSFADVDLGCNPANPQASLGTATATDACGAVTITSEDGLVLSNGCNRTQRRTFTAKDACGNAVIASRTVRWTFDLTAPVFTSSLADVDLGCNPANPQASLGTATATDACGAVTITSDDGLVLSNGCNRTQRRTFTAKDACGNAVIASRTVRWTFDHTAPTIIITGDCPSDLGCNPGSHHDGDDDDDDDDRMNRNTTNNPPNDIFCNATATDACGTPTLTSSVGPVISNGCNRSQTKTWTAKDACGNTSTASRTVTWIEDHTPPVFTGDYDFVYLGCNPDDPQASLGSATATDACGTVTITSSDGPVLNLGCLYFQTRFFTAKDACGNIAVKSRTVKWISDLTPPIILIVGDRSPDLGCNPSSVDLDDICGIVTAFDLCSIYAELTHSDGPVVSNGCSRSQTRTWTATDGCGNTATKSITATWIVDKTPPSFTGTYSDVNLGCNPTEPAGSLGTATATDACGAVTITSTTGSVVSNDCNRSITRTFTAKDACGNTATTSRTVRWTFDVTPPSFTGDYGTYDEVSLICNAENAPGSLGSASATDACGPVTITSSDGSVVSDGCSRSITRTFTAKDGCNNTATISRTVSWLAITTSPIISVGGQSISGTTIIDLLCNPSDVQINATLGTGNATNGCGNTPSPTVTAQDGPVTSDGCARAKIRTFTATDGCGHISTAAIKVIWIINNLGPQINTQSTTPANLGCNPSSSDINAALGTVSATDACANITITSSDGSVVSEGCSRSKTRTFTATGGCGNTATASRTVTWIEDHTPPVFTGDYDFVYLGCNPDDPQASLGSATATDACGAVTITSFDGPVLNLGCLYFQTRFFTAKDACGNIAVKSRTVKWISDLTPPIILIVGDRSPDLGCNPSSVDLDDICGIVTAFDLCSIHAELTHSDGPVVSNGCSRSQTRTWTATDGCGNTATKSITATWIVDHTPPSFTGTYTDVNLGCNPVEPAGSLGTATATDACGAVTITSTTGSVVSDGCNRSQKRTFTAKDGCGNTATTSRTVRWTSDNTPPTIILTCGSLDLGCNPGNNSNNNDKISTGGNGNAINFNTICSATATDACGPTTLTSSDGAVVSNGCNRSLTRTWTAKDACGNTSTASRTITWTEDHTDPVFTGDYDFVYLGCNPDDPQASLGSATATDACGTVTITSFDGPVLNLGCLYFQTRFFTAKDACGNIAVKSRTVKWISDLTPPIILIVGDRSPDLGCNPSSVDLDDICGIVTAFDLCSIHAELTHSDGPVVSNGCSRSQTRTWTATDGCGNTATKSITATWIVDHTPPSFTGTYTDVNLGCNPVEPAGSLGTATATDACGAVTITSTTGSVVSDGCNRSQKRTFTAKDGCGNTATTSRTVRWTSDNTPPTIILTCGSLDLGCNPGNNSNNNDKISTGGNGNAINFNTICSATATDACGPTTLTSSDGAVVSNGCNRSLTRTWTAKDACGNTSTASRTITWTEDHTDPVFTGDYDFVYLGCNPDDPQASLGSATATDACGAVTITSFDGPVLNLGCLYFQTRFFTAKDACGNIAVKSRTVKWISDLTPPIILIVGDRSPDLGCNPSSVDLDDICGIVTAFDLCSIHAELTHSDGPVVSNGCSRSQTRTWTATDGCGNTATKSITATWIIDHTPPSFTGNYSDVNLTCNAENAPGSLGTATATDACGAVTITSSTGSIVSNDCNRSITRTFTAKDGCGNTATISRTVKWKAILTSPILTIGGLAIPPSQEFDLGCNPPDLSIEAQLGTANATNGCATPTVTAQDGPTTTSTSNACVRVRARTFTATDDCGHIVTAVRIVRWIVNNLGPLVNTQSTAPTALGCNPSSSDINAALGTITATDACANATITSSDGSVVSNGCSRSLTRTFTATGGCGNTATASRTVTWTSDQTPPSFTGSYSDLNLGCNPTEPAGSLGTATATDACGAVTITSSTGSVVNDGCNRSQKRTFTARDACGNTATTSRTVRWKFDNTPPTIIITGGGSLYLGCNPYTINLNAVCGNVTATDACGSTTLTSGDGPIVSDGCDRSQTRTWTARDACGNTSTASRTVRWTSDHTPPVFTSVPPCLDYVCSSDVPGIVTPTASDACCIPTVTLGECTDNPEGHRTTTGSNCNRIITRTWIAKDCCGNTSYYTQTIKVKCCWNDGDHKIVTSNSTTPKDSLVVSPFPNPYKENFSLKINSPITGQALISFYTVNGVKVGEMKREVFANKEVWVPYKVPSAFRTRLVYTVSVGHYYARGIVLSPN